MASYTASRYDLGGKYNSVWGGLVDLALGQSQQNRRLAIARNTALFNSVGHGLFFEILTE
jgi:hypothetical protein